MMKSILRILKKSDKHWVGDGFPVTTLFSYDDPAHGISPFLLLDYAGPEYFEPTEHRRGVGQHPHRGFETVTIVYQGEVEHQDNAGNQGKIGPGDVQWMTAAKGILHEEKHSLEFTQKGGMLEMVQLWVNLPAKYKMSSPKYQDISAQMIPVIELAQATGSIRVIAGKYADITGVANTFTPVNLWDIHLKAGHTLVLDTPKHDNALILMRSGEALLNDGQAIQPRALAQFKQDGETISIHAESDANMLFMGGEPIDEPVVGRGPFVMNTADEIQAAYADFQRGCF